MKDSEFGMRCWLAGEPSGEALKELYGEVHLETPPESKRFKAVSLQQGHFAAGRSEAHGGTTIPDQSRRSGSIVVPGASAGLDSDKLKVVKCWLPITPYTGFSVHFEELAPPLTTPTTAAEPSPLIDQNAPVNKRVSVGEDQPIRSPHVGMEFGDTETTATPSCNSAISSNWTPGFARMGSGRATGSARSHGSKSVLQERSQEGSTLPSRVENLGEFDLAVEVLLDGEFVRGRYRKVGQRGVFRIVNGTVKNGLVPTGTCLQFPDLKDIEDSLSMANDQGLGSICVDVWIGKQTSSSNPALLTADDYGDSVPRPGGSAPPAFVIGDQAIDHLSNFVFERRLLRFEFKYRTAGFMASHHFVQVGKHINAARKNDSQNTKTFTRGAIVVTPAKRLGIDRGTATEPQLPLAIGSVKNVAASRAQT